MAYTLPVKKSPDTIGAVELTSIARGFVLVDLMVKKAPVEVLDARAVCPGKFLIVVAGDVASVEEAVAAARTAAGTAYFGDLLIPNLSPAVIPAINREVRGDVGETIGVVESFSAVATIDAADAAVKGAEVTVESVNLLDGLGGKAFAVFSGLLTDVAEALEAATRRMPDGMLVASEIVPQFSAELIPFLPGRSGERG